MRGLMARDGIDAVCGFPPIEYGSDYAEINTFNVRESVSKHRDRIYPFIRVNPLRRDRLPLAHYAQMGAQRPGAVGKVLGTSPRLRPSGPGGQVGSAA